MKYVNVELFISRFSDPVYVDFDYYKGSPGSMYTKHGDPGNPPEAPEIELLIVRPYRGAFDITDHLTSDDITDLKDRCFEYIGDYNEMLDRRRAFGTRSG